MTKHVKSQMIMSYELGQITSVAMSLQDGRFVIRISAYT